MQMTAALHMVPDPDDEQPPTPDTSGEQQPAPEPAPAPGVEQEPGEELHDDEDEEPAPRRALALPDLRPYADVTAVPQVLHAGVTATRRARAQRTEHRKGRPRRLLAIAVDVAAGSVLLLRHVPAWLGGEYGPKSVKGGGRFGLAFLGGYFGYRTVDTWPLHGTAGLATLWLAAALGERHRQRAEHKDAAGDSPKATEQAPARRRWWSRTARPEQSAGESTPAPGQDPADTPEATAEGPVEQAPAPPSREDIATALHGLVGEGRGVLLTTLRQALDLPDTRAVRELLDGAGIRVRAGVRTVAGNGPGVHTSDFPPLPSPQEGGSDLRCWPTANANNAANTPGEGLDAAGNDPDGRYPFDVLPDPERGPTAWRVVPHPPRD
ncbi:hypothetical protein [Streptomyces sp. KAU_LT]|uniref:hypothetical protein n=1 Tax=Streptomyces sp. KAU_LT TaxID=3046669 RepID=UPI0024B78206|nr:hypothetical protein [Streptomyces sp. KAU_LT]MDI9836252.1 hypothetical protein [Streptomyces sp. KAU_LT]